MGYIYLSVSTHFFPRRETLIIFQAIIFPKQNYTGRQTITEKSRRISRVHKYKFNLKGVIKNWHVSCSIDWTNRRPRLKTEKEMEIRFSSVIRTETKRGQPANDVLVTDYCAIKWRKEFECNVTADAFIEYLITKFFS